MNILEFINQEIERFEKKISKLREDQAFHLNYEHEDEAIEIDFEIEEYQDLLETLYQIKTELENWEVVKRRLKKEKYTGAYIYMKNITKDHPSYRAIEKSLEVKDEDRE